MNRKLNNYELKEIKGTVGTYIVKNVGTLKGLGFSIHYFCGNIKVRCLRLVLGTTIITTLWLCGGT
jgi:hypothetical protein